MRNATTSNASQKKLPAFIAYTVQDREGKKPYWQKIGGAWGHSDGRGFTLQLAAMPVDGRITLRLPPAKTPNKAASAAGRSTARPPF